MKNFSKKALFPIKLAAALLSAWYCLTETESTKTAVSEALSRCLNTIVPSLYAMLIISGFLIKSGIIDAVPLFFKRAGKILFGMNGSIYPIFLFSMFAGYPVGAKMLCSEYRSGSISKRHAELLSGICYGAGPAFIFGCISGQLYSSPTAGRIILLSTTASNILLAFAVSFLIRHSTAESSRRRSIDISGNTLTECILSGGRSMTDICFMIIAFSVIASVLKDYGTISAAGAFLSELSGIDADSSEQLLSAFLDVTSVNGLPRGDYTLLPYICALSSFGGICVIFQIAAVTSGCYSLKPLIFLRLAAAVLSFLICNSIMPFMLKEEVLAVSTFNAGAYKSGSPVPSVMLIIMTFMLFCEYSRQSDARHSQK